MTIHIEVQRHYPVCFGTWETGTASTIANASPFGFPLHFEGAWVPYEAEKDSYFVQQYGLDTPALVDKSVLRIIMLNA